MAKKLRFLFTLLFVMAATLSWGEEKTIKIDCSSFGLTTAYSTKTATINGVAFIVDQGYKGNNDVIQMNSSKGSGILYNTTPISGLKSITVNVHTGDKTYTVTTGTNTKPSDNSETGTETKTFNAKSGDTYFQLKVSGASYFSSIVVKYEDTRVSTTTSFPQNSYTAYLGEDFSAPVATLTANGGTLSEELSYSSSKTNVATVASDGSVSLKAKGTTTITATFAGNDNYIGSSASYTLTVENAPIIPKPINIGSGYYVKVTSADKLVDGDAILIVNESNKCAMSTTQNTNNRGQKIVTITNGIIDTPEETVQKIILVKSGDNWYLNVGENNNKNSFLYAASSSKNYLKSTTDPDNNALASISVTNGNATIIFQGDNTRNLLKYNSSDKLFSCYASGQQDIQIYKEVPVVAQIGDVKYETLQAAFDAATEGQTVTLLKDYDATKEAMAGGTRQFVIKKSITFDGGGFTLTTKERGIGVGNVNGDLSSNIDVTIKNVTINNTSSGARCIDTRGKIGSLTLEGVTLKTDGAPSGYTQPLTIGGNQSDPATVNITNSTIQTNDAGTAYYAIITFNPVNMTVTNSTIKGWANVYAKGADGSAGSAGSVFALDGCTLVSSNAYSGESNAFGAFVMEDNNITINVTNSNVTLNNTGDQTQALVSNNNHTDNNVTFGEGNKIKFVEPGKFDFVSNPGENIKFTVSGGLFNVSVPENLCAKGMIPAANTDSETSATYPYTVKVGQYVAQVGEQKFETFVDAVAAVTEENNVITLLANVTEGYIITADKALNVNLNGFTLTVNAPEGYLLKTEEKDGVTTYSAIAPVAQIGDVKYETIAAAVAAAEEGQTVKVIKGGEYTLPGIAKNITIEGAVDGVVFKDIPSNPTNENNIASIPNGATFKNIVLELGNINYHGFTHAGTINMEGCTINGKLFSYGDMNFTNCQFVQTTEGSESKGDYNMWVYSGNVVYDQCTFTNTFAGKLLHLYCEDVNLTHEVTVKDCKFINQGKESKAAINVKATSGNNVLQYNLHLEGNNTYEGNFPTAVGEQDNADKTWILSPLAQVDDRKISPDKITVTENGVLIYPATVAAIGETRYPTLQSAVDAAQQMGGEVTINIIDNISEETVTIQEVANFKLTIDGKKDENSNYTVDAVIVVDGLRANGGSSTNGASVTLQNIAFVKTTSTDGIQASHYPHHLTIRDCTYSGLDNDKWFLNASVDGPLYGVTVKNVTVEHARLIYANMAEDALFQNITATNDVKVGFNVKTSGTALIENCQVTTGKYAFRDYSDGYEGTFTLKDNTFVSTSEESDEGVIVNRGGAVGTAHINVVSGTYTGHVKVMNNKEGVLAISGGYFSEEFPQEYIAADLVAQEKICVPAADMEGYYTVGDPTFVAQIGETKYTSLAKAIAAVPTDGTETTIQMIADENIDVATGALIIAVGKNVVLELAGHSVVGECASGTTSALITNNGTLTIQDNTDTNKDGTGNGKLISGADPTWTWDGTDDYAGSYASNLIRNEGILVVNSGLLNNVSKGSAAYAIDNYGSGSITINGGMMDAAKASAIRMFYNNGGSLIVNGGVIGSNTTYMGVQVQGSNTNEVHVYLYGGTYSASNESFAVYSGPENSSSEFIISGGTYNNYVGFSGSFTNVSVTNGTFNAWCGSYGDVKFISGGLFAENPTEYLVEGYTYIMEGEMYRVILASAIPTTPVVFHDSGEYEEELSVPMYAQAGAKIYYTIGESTEAQEYSTPLTIKEDTKITAWSELNGVKSAVVTREYTIKAAADEIEAIDGYYSIKNNGNEKYINVAGRKTVTFVADGDEADKAGTVLKVKINTKGQVEELRSQGVDLPGYADRAMNYVPKFVKLIVDKLHAEGSGEILGANGLDAIMQKFNDSFDYHLYVEKADAGYRIYGKTPSMKPVVDFYAENKANVDYKLPKLEEFINSAIQKVLDKTGGRGASILTEFKLHDIWQKMGETLTEPVKDDAASIAKFYEEVLASEANVWNFAYQTAMTYWTNVKSHPRYEELKGKLGEYANYIEKVENIQPDFKYYIVGNTSGNGVDFISEGNIDIQNNAARTIWTMNERNDFAVKFTKENSLNIGRELYTTLYVDFAYTLPETVKAYKVTAIDETTGLATKEEITGVIPAQTPVLLQMIVDPKTVTDADLIQTLTLSTEAGTAVAGNLLQGPEWLINKYSITAKQVEDLFGYVHDFLKLADVEALYDSYVKEYEYLMIRNAGTVNNKYFFGLSGDDIAEAEVNVCQLAKQGNPRQRLAFYHNLGKVEANKAFIPSETIDHVYLSLIGDVNRDGKVNITDVTCQIDIVLDKDKPEDNYDYDAADLDFNDDVTIYDVTDLIDVVLGKKIIE